MEAAVPVSTIDRSGKIIDTHWSAPFTDELQLTLPPSEGAYAVVVDAQELAPETDVTDNRIRLNGVLRKWETPRLQPFAGLPRNDRQQLFWLPTVGWNTTDKWMAGVALYNSSLVEKKFNYFLMPMFSFSRGELKGMASANYNLYPQHLTHRATLGIETARFVNFEKVQPYLELELTRGIADKPKQLVRYSYTDINEVFPLESILATGNLQAHTVSYLLSKKNAVNSFNFLVQGRHFSSTRNNEMMTGKDEVVNLKAEAQFSHKYAKKDKIWLRLFAGKNFEDYTGFVMGLSGSPDYLKETIFLDRAMNNSFLKGYEHQTDGRDGGFKTYVPGAFAMEWMTTLNTEIDLPKLPLRVFADIGLHEYQGAATDLLYDAGLTLPFTPFLDIYFPVAGSNYELGGTKNSHLPESFTEFRDNIRVNLRLNALNPFELLRSNID